MQAVAARGLRKTGTGGGLHLDRAAELGMGGGLHLGGGSAQTYKICAAARLLGCSAARHGPEGGAGERKDSAKMRRDTVGRQSVVRVGTAHWGGVRKASYVGENKRFAYCHSCGARHWCAPAWDSQAGRRGALRGG
ncbi:hypothetical protein FGB62_62g143 [Gracilaria domingensis]|nr:hypothetical protein FGB62_62g143 [Gracilaria domingensis]